MVPCVRQQLAFGAGPRCCCSCSGRGIAHDCAGFAAALAASALSLRPSLAQVCLSRASAHAASCCILVLLCPSGHAHSRAGRHFLMPTPCMAWLPVRRWGMRLRSPSRTILLTSCGPWRVGSTCLTKSECHHAPGAGKCMPPCTWCRKVHATMHLVQAC